MATIQFGGLATGLDTSSIIESLMEIERTPITLLETKQTELESRLEAVTELDTKLNDFADLIKDLNYSSKLLTNSVTQSSDEYFTATASASAEAGAQYEVEVVSVAQVQKSVTTNGVASRTTATFGTGTLELTVGDETFSIEITEENNSLEGIANAINEAGAGVTAGTINTGTGDTPYLLSLTGANVATTFSLDASGLSGGTDTLDSLNISDGAGGTINPPVQEASQAHIRVDTIDIYSDSNTIEEAIPGVTLDLLSAEEGETTTIEIELDSSNIKSMLNDFVTGYNDIMSFIADQMPSGSSDGGPLANDSSVRAIKRNLQSLLTTSVKNSGVFTAFSQLGLETGQDGTLALNETTLDEAIEDNLDSVVTLLSGEDDVTGIGTQYKNYLYSLTNSKSGILKTQTDSIEESEDRIDSRIESLESRLEKRQALLEAQFAALETIVSEYNTLSDYLTTQMEAISNLYNS